MRPNCKTWLIAVLGLLGLFSCQSAPIITEPDLSNLPPDTYEGLAIIQGVTTDHSTQIAVILPKNANYQFALIEEENSRELPTVYKRKATRSFSDFAVQQLQYSNLRKKQRYRFEVKNEQGEIVDQRFLKPLDTTNKSPRIVVGSCADDSYIKEQKEIWLNIQKHDPDVIFMIGDNVYADKNVNFYAGPAEPTTVWKRYIDTFRNLEIYRFKDLIPVFATWDDHDFGLDNGDENYRWKSSSQDIFKTFFPRRAVPGIWDLGPGLAGSFKAFGQVFVFLDDRSFRSPRGHPTQDRHLGLRQFNWASNEISKAKNHPAWMISGDQFFGGYHKFESYQGHHPNDFKSFIEMLKIKKQAVAFLSGDLHRAEIMRIPADFLGYETYEITTSPLHAKTFSESRFEGMENPYALEQVNLELNYLVLELKSSDLARVRAEASIYGINRSRLASKSFTLEKE